MTRSRKHDVSSTKLGHDVADKASAMCDNSDVLIEISTIQQSPDIKVYRNNFTGKYYASWYNSDLCGFTELKEVPVEWVNNVLDGNVSFIDPVQSGNDLSGESYNLGEFEAVQRKLVWEGQKTTYWRKEAESRQRDIELYKRAIKIKNKEVIISIVLSILISSAWCLESWFRQ